MDLHEEIALHLPVIKSMCRALTRQYRLRNREDTIEELTQRAATRAIYRSCTFELGADIKPWLKKITFSVTMDYLREIQRRPTCSLKEINNPNSKGQLTIKTAVVTENHDSTLANKEAIKIAVSGFNVKKIGLLLQTYLDDTPSMEIAASRNICAGTVRVELFRIRRQCRQNLINVGITNFFT